MSNFIAWSCRFQFPFWRIDDGDKAGNRTQGDANEKNLRDFRNNILDRQAQRIKDMGRLFEEIL